MNENTSARIRHFVARLRRRTTAHDRPPAPPVDGSAVPTTVWIGAPPGLGQREDLRAAIAFLVVPPATLGAWPDFHAAFAALVDDVAEDVIAAAPGRALKSADLRAHGYQNGPPRAGMDGVGTVLVEVLGQTDALVQRFAGWLAVGGWAIAVGRRFKDRLRGTGRYVPELDGLAFTAPVLRAMCLVDAHARYGVPADAEIVGHARDVWYGSADHPTTDTRYTFVVAGPSARYIYVLDGRATVLDHFLMEGGHVRALDTPDWFGDLADRAVSTAYRELRPVVGGPYALEGAGSSTPNPP